MKLYAGELEELKEILDKIQFEGMFMKRYISQIIKMPRDVFVLLFGKNKRSVQCVHTWMPADLEVNYEYNGVSEDSEVYIVLICNKCNESKRVDGYTFQKMKRLGFI